MYYYKHIITYYNNNSEGAYPCGLPHDILSRVRAYPCGRLAYA